MKFKSLFYLAAFNLLAACGLFSSGLPASTTPTATLPGPAVSTTLPPNPEGTASAFLNAWAQKDYAGMYALLSHLSQDAISQDEFVARYSDAAAQMTLKSIETSILSALSQEQGWKNTFISTWFQDGREIRVL